MSAPNASLKLNLTGPYSLSQSAQVPKGPGLYIVTCGECTAHIGTSGDLRNRVSTLARLGTHRGSPEVLCAAYCTKTEPLVWCETYATAEAARSVESRLKAELGEPPTLRPQFERCVNGLGLLDALVAAAGEESFEAGFATATMRNGENLRFLFEERFAAIWKKVGKPPGPWL